VLHGHLDPIGYQGGAEDLASFLLGDQPKPARRHHADGAIIVDDGLPDVMMRRQLQNGAEGHWGYRDRGRYCTASQSAPPGKQSEHECRQNHGLTSS